MPNLTTEEIKVLKKNLKKDPSDFECRYQLIKHYWRLRYIDTDNAQAHAQLVFGLIETDPANPILSDPYCNLCNNAKALMEQAEELYQKAIKSHPKKAAVNLNAAWFHYQLESLKAETLFQKCCKLEPENPLYHSELGRYYSLILPDPDDSNYKSIAQNSLHAYEQAFQFYDSEEHFHKLPDLAYAALNLGETDKATKYAKDLIKAAASNKGSWHYGNALHHGNIILGKIALAKPDKKNAKKHLLASAEYAKGSPQLNSFGPDLTLAQQLLDQKQFDVVKTYLEKCRVFWESDRAEKLIKKMSAEIEDGKIPDLEALKYK